MRKRTNEQGTMVPITRRRTKHSARATFSLAPPFGPYPIGSEILCLRGSQPSLVAIEHYCLIHGTPVFWMVRPSSHHQQEQEQEQEQEERVGYIRIPLDEGRQSFERVRKQAQRLGIQVGQVVGADMPFQLAKQEHVYWQQQQQQQQQQPPQSLSPQEGGS